MYLAKSGMVRYNISEYDNMNLSAQVMDNSLCDILCLVGSLVRCKERIKIK